MKGYATNIEYIAYEEKDLNSNQDFPIDARRKMDAEGKNRQRSHFK